MLPLEEHGMARKRYSDDDCLKILRQVEVELAGGSDVPTACRSAGISDALYARKCSTPNGSRPLGKLRSSSINGCDSTIMSGPRQTEGAGHVKFTVGPGYQRLESHPPPFDWPILSRADTVEKSS